MLMRKGKRWLLDGKMANFQCNLGPSTFLRTIGRPSHVCASPEAMRVSINRATFCCRAMWATMAAGRLISTPVNYGIQSRREYLPVLFRPPLLSLAGKDGSVLSTPGRQRSRRVAGPASYLARKRATKNAELDGLAAKPASSLSWLYAT